MIEYRVGNILEADAEALVNTVNCVGVMGRGIALQFKEAFPANFKAYAAACARHEVEPGRMFVVETGLVTNPKFIINFPTKRHWRGRSRIGDIDVGLEALVHEIRRRDIRSIAVPPLGSGLGGIDWREVRGRIEERLRILFDVHVVVYEPAADAARPVERPTGRVPKMTPGRASLVVLVRRYLDGLLDPFVTLLEVHKLLYFMQTSGQPLRLSYDKGPYGPYAENLRHVLRKVEGYFLSGYMDRGDIPNQRLTLVPGAVKDAEAFLEGDVETRSRFECVADLVEGFETPFGLELLSTVHWVVTREGAATVDEAVALTYAWNDRKRRFSTRQIALAFDVLVQKGWAGRSQGLE